MAFTANPTNKDILSEGGYYYTAIKPIELDLNVENAEITWEDYTDESQYWCISSFDGEQPVSVLGHGSQVAGTYDGDALDDTYCFVEDFTAHKRDTFVDGSCTVTVEGATVTVTGTFTGESGKVYNLTLTNASNIVPGAQWLNGETIAHYSGTIWIGGGDLPMDFSESYDRVDYVGRRGALYFEYTLSGYYQTFYVPAEGHRDAPIGIELVSGTGTQEDPYVFKGVFDEQAEVEDVKVGLRLLTLDVIEDNDEFFAVEDLEDFVPYEDLDLWCLSPDLDGEFYVIYRGKTQEEGSNGFWWVKFVDGELTEFGSNAPYNSNIRGWLESDKYYYTVAAPVHTHDYATEWSSDDSKHRHVCTGEGDCDAPKTDEAEHAFGTDGE